MLDELLSLSTAFFFGSVVLEDLRCDCVATLPAAFETDLGL